MWDGRLGRPANYCFAALPLTPLYRDNARREICIFPQRGGDSAQDRLNPKKLRIHLLNSSFASLWHVVVRDDLQCIANVVIQFGNPPQPAVHGLIASLYVGQNQEYQYADC